MTKKQKQQLGDLWCRIDNEGFGYYMLHYSPNLDLIANLGFNKEELQKAIRLFKTIETKINECEKYANIEEED